MNGKKIGEVGSEHGGKISPLMDQVENGWLSGCPTRYRGKKGKYSLMRDTESIISGKSEWINRSSGRRRGGNE